MWYSECGKDSDVVLSSRVRLARNIDKIPFPARANENEQEEIIKNALKESNRLFVPTIQPKRISYLSSVFISLAV